MKPKISIQNDDFDVGAEVEALSIASGDCGAVVAFVGLCRSENDRLRGLEIEAYPEMAKSEISAIVAVAADRWDIAGASVVHRYGRIPAGGHIVFTAIASAHRHDAFCAAEFVMDFLKQRAPFWKRELRVDDEAGSGRWIEARHSDVVALERWVDTHD